MNNPQLDKLIREKMRDHIPSRPLQVLHCGVIILVSIVIGVFSLSPDPAQHGRGPGAWVGVLLAVSGLAIYFAWTSFRIARIKKEANAELLAASGKRGGN